MCPSTYVEVYDVNAPLDIPWKDFGRAKAALEAHQRLGSSHFDWKLDAQSIGEKVGWELWERSSYMYFVVSGWTFSCPQPSQAVSSIQGNTSDTSTQEKSTVETLQRSDHWQVGGLGAVGALLLHVLRGVKPPAKSAGNPSSRMHDS